MGWNIILPSVHSVLYASLFATYSRFCTVKRQVYLLFPVLGQYAEARADLRLATDFLKDTYIVELHGYSGDNVHYILDVLKPPRLETISTSDLRSSPEVVFNDVTFGPLASELYGTARRLKRSRHQPPRLKSVSASGSKFSPEMASNNVIVPTSGPSVQTYGRSWRLRRSKQHLAIVDQENGRHGQPEPEVDIVVLDSERQSEEDDVTYQSMSGWNETTQAKYAERYTYVTRLLKIAHGLHYVGIGILAFFVVQVRHLHVTPAAGLAYVVITIAIRLRSDYDVSRAPASIRRDSTPAKNEHVNFSS